MNNMSHLREAIEKLSTLVTHEWDEPLHWVKKDDVLDALASLPSSPPQSRPGHRSQEWLDGYAQACSEQGKSRAVPLNEEEVFTLLKGRFAIQGNKVAWLTDQLNKLLEVKRADAASPVQGVQATRGALAKEIATKLGFCDDDVTEAIQGVLDDAAAGQRAEGAEAGGAAELLRLVWQQYGVNGDMPAATLERIEQFLNSPPISAEFFLHQREIDGPTMLTVAQMAGLLNEYAAPAAPPVAEKTEPPKKHELNAYDDLQCKNCGLGVGHWPSKPECAALAGKTELDQAGRGGQRCEGGDLCARITQYLSSGGLLNPEMANHEKVRDLLVDCREGLLTLSGSLRKASFAAPPSTLGSGQELRERIAKAIWDYEIAESIRIKAFPERAAKDYAQWPEDSLKQPYCQSTYRQADAVLAALALPLAPKVPHLSANVVEACAAGAVRIKADKTLTVDYEVLARLLNAELVRAERDGK